MADHWIFHSDELDTVVRDHSDLTIRIAPTQESGKSEAASDAASSQEPAKPVPQDISQGVKNVENAGNEVEHKTSCDVDSKTGGDVDSKTAGEIGSNVDGGADSDTDSEICFDSGCNVDSDTDDETDKKTVDTKNSKDTDKKNVKKENAGPTSCLCGRPFPRDLLLAAGYELDEPLEEDCRLRIPTTVRKQLWPSGG